MTKNLHNTVRYLRHQEPDSQKDECRSSSKNDTSDSDMTRWQWDPEASGVLWADAICINQADVDERSSQIGLMGDIYRRGSRLHVWIGTVHEIRNNLRQAHPPETQHAVPPERLAEARALLLEAGVTTQPPPLASAACSDEDTDVKGAMEILQLFAEDKHAYELPLFKSTAAGIDLEKAEFGHECMAMLLEILTQPWWKRVWVVQEVLLSSTPHANTLLHINHHKTSLASCESFLVYHTKDSVHGCSHWNVNVSGNRGLTQRHYDDWASLRSLKYLQELHMNGMVDLSASYDEICRREATDPHDYIYGFRGLMEDLSPGLKVDYRTPVSQLYTGATKTILRDERSLDHLDSAVGTDAENQHHLPSWCLDWSEEVRFGDILISRWELFDAAQGWSYQFNHHDKDATYYL